MAYSKAGASGLWQFTRSTGVQFLTINDVVDERSDPYFSTVAAARFLKENYVQLEHLAPSDNRLQSRQGRHGAGGPRERLL